MPDGQRTRVRTFLASLSNKNATRCRIYSKEMQSSIHKIYQCALVSFSTGMPVDMGFVVYGRCMQQ